MDNPEDHILELKREIAAAKKLKHELQKQIDRLDRILRAARSSETTNEKDASKRAAQGETGSNTR